LTRKLACEILGGGERSHTLRPGDPVANFCWDLLLSLLLHQTGSCPHPISALTRRENKPLPLPRPRPHPPSLLTQGGEDPYPNSPLASCIKKTSFPTFALRSISSLSSKKKKTFPERHPPSSICLESDKTRATRVSP
jgi:hypothetical protein